MHLHIRRENPAFHIDLLLVCVHGQGLNCHWPKIYIERSKNTQSREAERKCALLFRERLPIGARQSHNFIFSCTAVPHCLWSARPRRL